MADPLAIPAADTDSISGKGGKKKKEEKFEISLDKLEFALYRAQLATVRTATTTTSLGFVLYKLLEEKTHDGSKRPILDIFTPRLIALILFFSGFLGLLTYCFRHAATLKKINRFSPKFYYSGVMLVSYVILALTLLLFVGTFLKG